MTTYELPPEPVARASRRTPMPDITIPDAAVEAACHQWRRIDPIIGTGDVRQIVTAAAPYIAAQALRDAADSFLAKFGGFDPGAAVANDLNALADQIEAEQG